MKQILFLVLLIPLLGVGQQAPGIEWEKSLGGSTNDQAHSIKVTTDGGYIMAGRSNSNNGDITDPKGGFDYWIVKLDADAEIVWQKSYGGTGADIAYSVIQTSDGGYAVAGSSDSDNGDITDPNGSNDYWIIKLDTSGNLVWEKSFGGTGADVAYSIVQTTDGGYVVAGNSNSQDGDITNPNGSNDYWIIKLNTSGNLVWEKSFGGTGADVAYSIIQTADGGYVVTGQSNSSNGDVTDPKGGNDYWVIKLDTNGNLLWEESYGGAGNDIARSVIQTTDGGFVIAGVSNSTDGDVTGNIGNNDVWVVKTDAMGNLVWQKNYGGTASEDITLGSVSIIQALDDNLVVAASTNSNDGDLLYNNGGADFFVCNINAVNGNLNWHRNLGGTSLDCAWAVTQTSDEKFVVAGLSASSDVDVTSDFDTTWYDYWIVKLGDPILTESVNISILNDASADIYPTQNIQLAATVQPQYAVSGVIWSVFSGEDFVTVNNTGLVTGIAPGTAIIRATSIESTDVYGEIIINVLTPGWNQLGSTLFGNAYTHPDYPSSKWSFFGYSVALSADGSIMAVGAPTDTSSGSTLLNSYVGVFRYVSGEWVQIGEDIMGAQPLSGSFSPRAGVNVSLSSDGNILAVGESHYQGILGNEIEIGGRVRIFQNINDEWVQVGDDISQIGLSGDANSSYTFGYSVSLSADGDILAIGAPYHTTNGQNLGMVRTYQNVSGEWVLLGSSIIGEEVNGYFGGVVSLSKQGDVLAVSAQQSSVNGPNSGQVRVYKFISGEWELIGVFNGSGAYSQLRDVALSVDGTRLVFGMEQTSPPGGTVQIHQYSEGDWTQIGSVSGSSSNDRIGYSVDISANGTVIATSSGTGYGASSARVRVFKEEGSDWVQVDNNISISDGGFFYNSLSLSSDGAVLAVGAPQQLVGTEHLSGRVYVFYNCSLAQIEVAATEVGEAVCEGGIIEASATAGFEWYEDSATINWYDSEDAAEPVFTGTEFITPELSATTSYWVEAVTPTGCPSERVEVVAAVTPTPEITVEDFNNPCEGAATDIIVLSAGNTVNWYSSETATEIIFTGAEFTTPELSESTSYWVEAVSSGGCLSERTEIVLTVNPLPELTVDNTMFTICEGATTTFTASSTTGNLIVWYDSQEATDWIAVGAEFVTPELVETTSYWVQAYSPQTHCVSEKVEIVVTVNESIISVVEFGYPENTYCFSSDNPLPVLANGFHTGGIFSSSLGLAINSSTGEIDILNSLEGTYLVFYTVEEDTNPGVCFTSGEYEFEVILQDCKLQKGISPNGDGLNDWFDLTGMGVRRLSIYNRYGREVYAQSNYVKEWGGQDKNNNELPDGTYFYTIEKNNGEQLTGWVYINRNY